MGAILKCLRSYCCCNCYSVDCSESERRRDLFLVRIASSSPAASSSATTTIIFWRFCRWCYYGGLGGSSAIGGANLLLMFGGWWRSSRGSMTVIIIIIVNWWKRVNRRRWCRHRSDCCCWVSIMMFLGAVACFFQLQSNPMSVMRYKKISRMSFHVSEERGEEIGDQSVIFIVFVRGASSWWRTMTDPSSLMTDYDGW